MSISIEFFIEALEREPQKIRKQVGFAYEVLKAECSKALSSPDRIPKSYFVKRTREILSYHRTDSEFDALQICVLALFRYCASQNDELREPALYLRPAPELPYFNENSPGLALCEFAGLLTSTALKLATSDEELLALLILLLAQRTQTTSLKKLEQLVNTDITELVLFPNAEIAAIETKSKRFLLDPVALGAFRRIKAFHSRRIALSKLNAMLREVISGYAVKFNFTAHQASPTNVLEALNFFSRSVASHRLEPLFKPLCGADFVRAMSGQVISRANTENRTPIQRKKRRSTKEFLSLDKIATLFQENEARALAIDARAKSADSHLLESIRKNISNFKSVTKDEKRNSLAFKALKSNVLAILTAAVKDVSGISLTAVAIATYHIDLLLNGSAFKERLAIQTILSYLSTIQIFASKVWQDETLLKRAQYDEIAIETLTENVSVTLSGLGASEQSRVMGFLQYLFQASPLKLFAPELLEYFGAGEIETRAHYICPQDFENACNEFLSINSGQERRQFVLFAKLSYATGLRRLEAAQLLVSELREDLQTLYVSREFKRKTVRAYRKIPQCFLPDSLKSELFLQAKSQEYLHQEYLFDQSILSALTSDFLTTLRKTCNQSELVLHSLRHSAINNILFQFLLCASSALRPYREKIYFLQGNCFDDVQLKEIEDSIENLGWPVNEHLPIFDIVSQLAGHTSPLVTASSYLHLLDLTFFLKNAERNKTLSVDSFLKLLPPNNYRFHLKKEYEQALSTSAENPDDFLFRVFSRGLPDAQKYRLMSKQAPRTKQASLTFSDFLSELKKYKNAVGSQHSNEALFHYFRCNAQDIDISFVDKLTQGRCLPAWIRLLDQLANISWNCKNKNALNTLSVTLKRDRINELRTAERHLRALTLIGLSNSAISLYVNAQDIVRNTSWHSALEKFEFEISTVTSSELKSPYIKSKPESLRWPLWRYLPEILQAFRSYQLYLQTTQKEPNQW